MCEVFVKKGNKLVATKEVVAKPKPSNGLKVTERDRAAAQPKQAEPAGNNTVQEVRRPASLRERAEAGLLTSRQAAMLRF